jgi:hypothetical protein
MCHFCHSSNPPRLLVFLSGEGAGVVMRLSGCLSQGRETAIRNSVIAGLAVFCGGIAGTTPAAATTPSNVFDLIIGYAGTRDFRHRASDWVRSIAISRQSETAFSA